MHLTIGSISGFCSPFLAGRRPISHSRSRRSPIFFGLLVICQFVFLASLLNAQNIISTVAGGVVPSGAATAADIPGPTSVAEDSAGNIYIAAPSSYYVFKVASGSISIFAGTGIQGFSGDNGPATSAALEGPAALTFDSSGDLYIADLNRVRCILAVSGGCMGSAGAVGNIITLAGTGPVCDNSRTACGDGGPATAAQLDAPQALALDGSGNLYIADTQDMRIRLVTKSTGFISTVAGTGKTCDGPTEPCGDNAPATAAYLDLPTGVAVDSLGDIFIGDTRDQRIRCIVAVAGGCVGSTSAMGNIVNVIGNGKVCNGPTLPCGDGGPASSAHLLNPSGLSFDSNGNLYFADQLDHRIRCVIYKTGGCSSGKPVGDIVAAVGNGNQGFFGDGGAASAAFLDLPDAVVVDSKGNLLIPDAGNQRIREVTGGNINTVAGGGLGGDGSAPTQATLANPTGVTWDGSGNFYIADTANNRIREVSSGADSIITTVAGNGSLGSSGDGGSALSATMNGPNGVAVDASGNVYIADTNNYVIRAVNMQGSPIVIDGVAIPPGNIATVVGQITVQCTDTGKCGDTGQATAAQLADPTSIAFDNNNNLYIADYHGNRVRVVNLVSGIINTEAGTGVRGYGGDGGPATSAQLNHDFGVATDPMGNVYISDAQNNRVRCVITISGGCGGSAFPVGTILTYAFNGMNGFSGDGGLATKALMTGPLGAATDPAGNLYIGGGADSLVRRIDAATLTVDTVAGNPSNPGLIGFAGDGGPATSATLNNVGLAVNGVESLLIADSGNNRIRQVAMTAVIHRSTGGITFPATTVGQTSTPKSVKYTNQGAADQTLGAAQITGTNPHDFAISSNTCGAVLAPDQSCTINVTFSPKATGARSAHLKMAGTSTVNLSGTGD